MRLPIHRQGWPFIAIAVALNAALLLWLGWWGLILLPVTLWVVAFFRDPERQPPEGEGLIVSPADGVLLPLASAAPPGRAGSAAGSPHPPQHLHERVRHSCEQNPGKRDG